MIQLLGLSLTENKGERERCSREDLAEQSQVDREMHICMQAQGYPVSKQ